VLFSINGPSFVNEVCVAVEYSLLEVESKAYAIIGSRP
jgi:hypothetical protein